jgi:anti-sigma B factor antagonist
MPDSPLTYTSAPGASEGTTVLTLTGPLTLTTMFPLQAELRTLKPQVLILDLTAVPYIDSAGLGLIPTYFVSAEAQGRILLLAGVSQRVAAVMGHARIDTLVKIFPTVEEAEASL